MRKTVPAAPAGVVARLTAFVVERHPLALPLVLRIVDRLSAPSLPRDRESIQRFASAFLTQLDKALSDLDADAIPDTTPGVSASTRLHQAHVELRDACEGFLAREAIAASLTDDERRELLRGMILTRAVDNRLKQL